MWYPFCIPYSVANIRLYKVNYKPGKNMDMKTIFNVLTVKLTPSSIFKIDDDEFLRHPKTGTSGYLLPGSQGQV